MSGSPPAVGQRRHTDGIGGVVTLLCVVIAMPVIHLAGRTAQWVAGDGWAGPSMRDSDALANLIKGGPKGVWPTISLPIFGAIVVVQVLMICGIGIAAYGLAKGR